MGILSLGVQVQVMLLTELSPMRMYGLGHSFSGGFRYK